MVERQFEENYEKLLRGAVTVADVSDGVGREAIKELGIKLPEFNGLGLKRRKDLTQSLQRGRERFRVVQ